jgi:hypothetical protein
MPELDFDVYQSPAGESYDGFESFQATTQPMVWMNSGFGNEQPQTVAEVQMPQGDASTGVWFAQEPKRDVDMQAGRAGPPPEEMSRTEYLRLMDMADKLGYDVGKMDKADREAYEKLVGISTYRVEKEHRIFSNERTGPKAGEHTRGKFLGPMHLMRKTKEKQIDI